MIHPLIGKHRIRRAAAAYIRPAGRIATDCCPRKQFQQPHLQIVRAGGKKIGKGAAKTLFRLMGEAKNQIHMQMNGFKFRQPLDIIKSNDPIHSPIHGLQGWRMGGLHPDLKLKTSSRYRLQKGEHLFGKTIRADLKMEQGGNLVGHEKFPDGQGPPGLIIKGAIDKAQGGRLILKDLGQFRLNLGQRLVIHPLFRRRQAIGAGKGTASGTLIINIPVPQMGLEIPLAIGRHQKTIRHPQE